MLLPGCTHPTPQGRGSYHLNLLPVLVGLAFPHVYAQELSYDGQRWIEVEVSVFSNEYPATAYAEVPTPDKLSLQYLPRVQQLQEPASSFLIDFPQSLLPYLPTPGFSAVAPNGAVPPVEHLLIGPVYSPGLANSFKISDFSRDSYIALADSQAQFITINRNLQNSSEHRLFWHEVWRQPVLARSQTPAVYVQGGASFDEHTELEGSLRVSDDNNLTMLDINLWLSSFDNSDASSASVWTLPAVPLTNEQKVTPLAIKNTWTITQIWQQQQSQVLATQEFYYLDHPAFGILIQVRPYLLPEMAEIEDVADF
jgi:Peptidoglycan-binding protein, CsiV